MTTRTLDELIEMAVDMSDALHKLREAEFICPLCGADTTLDCHTGCAMHTAETVRIEYK